MSEFAAIFRAICLLTLLGASSVKFRKRIEVPIGFTTGKRAENAIGINSRIGSISMCARYESPNNYWSFWV